MSFRIQLEQMKDDFVKAHGDGSISLSEYFTLAADVCSNLEEVLRGIGGDDMQFDELVSDCEGIIRDYVVPIDLTKFKVPRMIEAMVIDPQLPMLVRPALEQVRARVVPGSTESSS